MQGGDDFPIGAQKLLALNLERARDPQ